VEERLSGKLKSFFKKCTFLREQKKVVKEETELEHLQSQLLLR
jgi:hypothetical protein